MGHEGGDTLVDVIVRDHEQAHKDAESYDPDAVKRLVYEDPTYDANEGEDNLPMDEEPHA